MGIELFEMGIELFDIGIELLEMGKSPLSDSGMIFDYN